MNDWHVVALSNTLITDKPLGVRLLEEDIVLWRVSGSTEYSGQVCAWQDLCLHRGTKLSLGRIANDRLACPYHGWEYNTEGQCVRYPAHPSQQPTAKARAKVYRACERYGLIWVCLGTPVHDIPVFEQWDDADFRKVFCGPYHYKASAPRAIENFLDVTHFPFVHQSYLGDPEHPEVNDYTVEVSDEGIIARDITVWQPDPDGTGEGKLVTYTYKVPRPFTASFVKSSTGPRFAMYFTITPVAVDQSIAWAYVAMDYSDLSEEAIRSYQDMITAQDVPIVESQRPELLPLDLQAELHLRSDRTAIAYRQWLRQLGVTFGTA
jgi:phenylpropionate dioxygenase-like ring-hydroxylating dioxygenase large terminal subunit